MAWVQLPYGMSYFYWTLNLQKLISNRMTRIHLMPLPLENKPNYTINGDTYDTRPYYGHGESIPDRRIGMN